MRRLPNAVAVTAALALLAGGAAAAGVETAGPAATPTRPAATHPAAVELLPDPVTTTPGGVPATTAPPATAGPPDTASAPPGDGASGQHGPITSPPLPSPGPGFVAGQVTAVGDSVMIDYEHVLGQDVPGIRVTAAVSRWWTTGRAVLAQLKAQGALGAVVVVGLGTNGPVTATQFDAMMQVLTGASRVVFVNVHVDRTWEGPNNAVLAAGVSRYPRAVLVDWYSLAQANPGWLYSTQTHLPIDGPGAQALANLVAAAA